MKKPQSLAPITEIFSVGAFGNVGMQAAIDTALKDDPICMLSIQLPQNQNITIAFDEPRIRDLSIKLGNLADILKAREKPGADKTPTAAQAVREQQQRATFFQSTSSA